MIFYDSHKWRTLLRLHGSVFPRAMLAGLPSALLALGVKYLDREGLLDISSLKVLNEGSIYSGLNFVLGFSLVFRTSQSYARYWMAATSVHEMGSEWSDACSSIIAFSRISHRPKEEVQRFAHTIVRLFSLLHAVALEEISSMEDDNFPLIDVQGFCKKDLSILAADATQGKKLQVILGWIKVYIIQCMETGLLSVPAPILTRVFQEFGAGLINYHKAQQVVIWPFPFPYTQLNLALLYVYMLFTPMVICVWDVEPWMCSLFTFISVVCMTGLDMIASELENPFGDDPNDLPGMEMQDAYNQGLVLMLNPEAWDPPHLLPSACMSHEVLAAQKTNERAPMPNFRSDSLLSFSHARSDKMGKQLSWAKQCYPQKKSQRVHHWLRLTQEDIDELEAGTPSDRSESKESKDSNFNVELDVPCQAPASLYRVQPTYSMIGPLPSQRSESSKERERLSFQQGAAERCGAGAAAHSQGLDRAAAQPWVDFYQALAADLHDSLRRQLQHQDAALQRQLALQERLISEWVASLRLRSDGSDDCPGASEYHHVPVGSPRKGRGCSAEAQKRPMPASAFGAEVTRRTLLGVTHSHEGKPPPQVSNV